MNLCIFQALHGTRKGRVTEIRIRNPEDKFYTYDTNVPPAFDDCFTRAVKLFRPRLTGQKLVIPVVEDGQNFKLFAENSGQKMVMTEKRMSAGEAIARDKHRTFEFLVCRARIEIHTPAAS